MKAKRIATKTTVGAIDRDVLAFTTGEDPVLDLVLAEADCLGTAAHVTMLSRMPLTPPLITAAEQKRVLTALRAVAQQVRDGAFRIRLDDQDVHLAVERKLTEQLGDLGKKIHTGRSRNDQVAVDLRLYGREQLLGALEECSALAEALLAVARKHVRVPMAGRTHMQPAMPSSVGLWASAFAEGLLEDMELLRNAYVLNNRCPLGSAASYGVPLPIDRRLVSDLLGFDRPIHNVLHANNARGKIESVILSALAQAMVTLSRLAQDLMLFTMPEFGWFRLPAELCTGSSIMPQKKNPDVLELIRAKTSTVLAAAQGTLDLIKGLPSGYNRDLQETKGLFMRGIATTRASLRLMKQMVVGLEIDQEALRRGFTPDVFATDGALELVAQGMPFRDAYHYIKAHLDALQHADPQAAIARKTHLGGTAGLDLKGLGKCARQTTVFVHKERRRLCRLAERLLGDS